ALAATGRDVTARAERLHAAATALASYPIDAQARVLDVLAGGKAHARTRGQLVATLVGAIRETAASATVTVSFVAAERPLLVSNVRTTALVLGALIREVPQHPAIPKLARGVLDARTHGRWSSTQENLVVVQALRRYFDTYEKQVPSYTGKLWFGQAAYAEQAFAGHTTTPGRVDLGWATLGLGTSHDVALQKVGTGRMYYRLGITYAPNQLDLPALDAGFVVRRSYRALGDPTDVVRGADGRWTVKLGARVAVELEVINTTERYNVAVVDPLPAGFEAIYTVTATMPGNFVVAPAKAEEMYAPETFGRSWGGLVVVR
ncbi:MAG: hypothetical protein NT062_25990, partial [Proteobacteria bacterium]|nr:hypothetical protein [Pseudomonadota bacterium]